MTSINFPGNSNGRTRERRNAIQRRVDKKAVINITSWWEVASDSALDEAVLKIGRRRVRNVVDRVTR
jgi:hypothetical protein